MKLSLIKPSVCVPNGFRWVDPVDGYVVVAHDYNSWVDNAKAHLRANGREVPIDLGAEMEDQLCQTLEPGWCSFDSDNRVRATVDMDWGDVAGGLKMFGDWVASGTPYVEQEEAERRAWICSRCYLNVNVSGCGACHKAVAAITKSRQTKHDASLRACGACACLLKAKVHFPLAMLERNSTQRAEAVYPQIPWCWLNKDGENYKPER